jgi:heptosyltransferase-3
VVETRVVGLHGPTSEARWGPIGPYAVAISAQGPGCGYLNLGFEYPARCDCMLRITVEQVLAKCRAILQLPARR